MQRELLLNGYWIGIRIHGPSVRGCGVRQIVRHVGGPSTPRNPQVSVSSPVTDKQQVATL